MSSQYQPLGHNPPGRRRSLLVQLTRSKIVIGIALLLFLTTLASHQGRTAAQTGIEKVKKFGQRIGGSVQEEESFVQLRKEELLELVGRNPRYLTMDGWATYGFK